MTPEELFTKIHTPLSGWKAQKLMSSKGYDKNRTANPDSKIAAVMMLLFQDDQEQWQTIYIKRPSTNPNDKHSGQISFPGGQQEAQDKDLIATALRETEEEIGIPPSDIKVLGPLSSIYVFVSDYNVFPYVGYLSGHPTFKVQESEVDYTIIHPLQDLLDAHPAPRKDLHISKEIILKDIPYYDVNGDTLWGATAMITSELLEMVRGN